MLGGSWDEDWSVREEPISEVVLVYKNGKVVAVYTPTAFDREMISAVPSLSTERIELNTMKLKDILLK